MGRYIYISKKASMIKTECTECGKNTIAFKYKEHMFCESCSTIIRKYRTMMKVLVGQNVNRLGNNTNTEIRWHVKQRKYVLRRKDSQQQKV